MLQTLLLPMLIRLGNPYRTIFTFYHPVADQIGVLQHRLVSSFKTSAANPIHPTLEVGPDLIQICVTSIKVQTYCIISFPICLQDARYKRIIQVFIDRQMQLAVFELWYLDWCAAQFIPGLVDYWLGSVNKLVAADSTNSSSVATKVLTNYFTRQSGLLAQVGVMLRFSPKLEHDGKNPLQKN